MKAQENVKDGINLQADALIDLPVTDEQSDETKGGAFGPRVNVFRGATGDVSGDGFDDIIVGAGPGAMGHVK